MRYSMSVEDICPPTPAQIAQINTMEAKYTQLVAENAMMMDMITEALSPSSIHALLTENSTTKHELYSTLGLQARSFAPLCPGHDLDDLAKSIDMTMGRDFDQLNDTESKVIMSIVRRMEEIDWDGGCLPDAMADTSSENSRYPLSQLTTDAPSSQSSTHNGTDQPDAVDLTIDAAEMDEPGPRQRVRKNVNGSTRAKRKKDRIREAQRVADLAAIVQ